MGILGKIGDVLTEEILFGALSQGPAAFGVEEVALIGRADADSPREADDLLHRIAVQNERAFHPGLPRLRPRPPGEW